MKLIFNKDGTRWSVDIIEARKWLFIARNEYDIEYNDYNKLHNFIKDKFDVDIPESQLYFADCPDEKDEAIDRYLQHKIHTGANSDWEDMCLGV